MYYVLNCHTYTLADCNSDHNTVYIMLEAICRVSLKQYLLPEDLGKMEAFKFILPKKKENINKFNKKLMIEKVDKNMQ